LNKSSEKIAFNQDYISFYISKPVHIAFAEMFKNLYLIILREETIISATISNEIIPSHRCESINEITGCHKNNF
jgi:hypothetical protein